ncbi:CHASE2 domain-containing protein [Allohahella marinimesophila]|uniref:CHASE2 domain-containing protein n=1 Tax=Allohahella marinimesophila TaxID=1054972 RepID=A0ABP7NLR8_9GAMM
MLRPKNHALAYYCFAVLLSIITLAEFLHFNFLGKLESGAYDLSLKHRLFHAPADPDIVIIDIDEKSLAAMGEEYGRWPWPRTVLAEFVEGLEAQSPAAVVFDILFSEPDIYNPESDAYLNSVADSYDNVFFPFIRLPSHNDSLSELRPSMVPGLERLDDLPSTDAPFAAILPFLSAATSSGRIGTNTIQPEDDGIVRSYELYEIHDGWLIPSLPLTLAKRLNGAVPQAQSLLINWRGDVGAYESVSFVEVFEDFLQRKPSRPANEFENRIIIIGSTAPSLHDLKPTPIARSHPGVEILATGIDNALNRDFIRTFQTPWVPLLTALLIIWLTALAFARQIPVTVIDGLYGASQGGLLVLGFASINLSDFYLDLSAPVFFGLAYFAVARGYQIYSTKSDSQRVWQKRFATPGPVGIGILHFPSKTETRQLRRQTLARMRKLFRTVHVEKVPAENSALQATFGETYFIFNLFDERPELFATGALHTHLLEARARPIPADSLFVATKVMQFDADRPANEQLWRSQAFKLLQQTTNTGKHSEQTPTN